MTFWGRKSKWAQFSYPRGAGGGENSEEQDTDGPCAVVPGL